MKNIIAFGASNSPTSINQQFATYAANQLKNVEITILNLNDFELPIYSPSVERISGIPANAQTFASHIQKSDAVVISLAEHNGLHTAAFKNLWDWMSRIDTPKIWHNKPMLLLGTSPSKREESNVMKVSKLLFPMFGAQIIASFHLPSFNQYFLDDNITEPELKEAFLKQVSHFQQIINI